MENLGLRSTLRSTLSLIFGLFLISLGITIGLVMDQTIIYQDTPIRIYSGLGFALLIIGILIFVFVLENLLQI